VLGVRHGTDDDLYRGRQSNLPSSDVLISLADEPGVTDHPVLLARSYRSMNSSENAPVP
jgi:hypothetical protein